MKAKWRPVREEERSRYHSVRVVFADGSTRLFGLTALHIASKDQPHWFWATFEQVDNPLQPGKEGWQLPSRDRFGCRGTAEDCNRAPRGVGLEGTVWQYYRLRGTLTQYVDGAGRPQRLANSELETGMQSTASCMTCHSRSSIGVVAGVPARLTVLDSGRGEAASDAAALGGSALGGSVRAESPPVGLAPVGLASGGLASGGLARRGFVGLPKDEWFGRREDAGGVGFWPLDFVWSLAKAQPRKVGVGFVPGVGQRAPADASLGSGAVISKAVSVGSSR